jgi:ribonuclease R
LWAEVNYTSANMTRAPLPTKAHVLALLHEDDRPWHAREIAERMGVADGSYPGLLRMLDDLAMIGSLTAQGQRFKLSKAARAARAEEPREGFLSMTPRGFGFVASGTGDDVFVPAESIGGAMHGDKVRVRVTGRDPRGASGVIEEVLERAFKRVAGVLRRKGSSAWLEPDDTRVRGPIVLPRAVDAAGPAGNSGQDGDAAVVTIVRFPERPDEHPEGRLEAILGRPGELSVEIAKVLVAHAIEEVHPPEVVAEAEAYGESVPEDMLEGREDLTHLPLPTIDPEDARDHDDAVWVERTNRGGYRATIAIADVSSYVREGTRLDAEARKRGCSIYLPERAIPMLPRALSSNLCSLLPDVVRLCLAVEVELDASGRVLSKRLVRGFMKSRAKLTYGGVARALGFSALPPRDPKADAMVDNLRVAAELSSLLRARRMKRGALDFDLPEAKIVIGEDGKPIDVVKRAEDPGVKKAYQLIEELMLLANEVVAEELLTRQVPTIFRVHGPPDEKKVLRFLEMCSQLGVEVEPEDVTDPKRLSELLGRIGELENASVLHMLLLRSMKQAQYDVANIGHFGLASKAYLHFTSPIRRYPDLVVHRAVHALAQGRRPSRAADSALSEAALESSKNERKAMEIEREIADLYRAFVMKDRVGERFFGTITAFVGSGAYIALDHPFVDVLVRFEDLGDAFEVDDDGLRATATRSGDTLMLGERLEVEIVDVQVLRRTVYARRILGEGRARTRAERRGVRREAAGRRDPRQAAKAAPARGAKPAHAKGSGKVPKGPKAEKPGGKGKRGRR